MIFKSISILILFFFLNQSWAQDSLTYQNHIDKALEFYKTKNYKASSLQYKLAFNKIDGAAYDTDRYNAACTYALSGNIDTAFYHIYRLINNSFYKDLEKIISDSDLTSLHSDKRWGEVIFITKHNKFNAERYLNLYYVALLDSIHDEDQKYRLQLDSINKTYGLQSKQVSKHWNLINYIDSLNLIEITKILDNKGWLGKDIVGDKGNSTLFLVIQHSNLKTQIKYLPMMREAVKKNNANGSDLALLEDRVAMRQGEKQIYGSQIGRDMETNEFFVYPIKNPENVNIKRNEVGLGTIEEYVLYWNIIWDIEKHKKRK
jgi:hypothetical protein